VAVIPLQLAPSAVQRGGIVKSRQHCWSAAQVIAPHETPTGFDVPLSLPPPLHAPLTQTWVPGQACVGSHLNLVAV